MTNDWEDESEDEVLTDADLDEAIAELSERIKTPQEVAELDQQYSESKNSVLNFRDLTNRFRTRIGPAKAATLVGSMLATIAAEQPDDEGQLILASLLSVSLVEWDREVANDEVDLSALDFATEPDEVDGDIQVTQYGFTWGPAVVTRTTNDDEYRVISITTDTKLVQVRISPKGRNVRVWLNGNELG